MGRSRSVAVVLAYLMRLFNLTLGEAYRHVQQIRRDIHINPGFVQQLEIWDIVKHNWENRYNYAEYRYWRMAYYAGLIARTPISLISLIVGNHYKYGTRSIILANRSSSWRNVGEFRELFPLPRADADNSIAPWRRFPDLQKPTDSYYRCGQCKYPLAPANSTFSFSDTHNPFDYAAPAETFCTHIFLSNPMSWMNLDTSSPGGKLLCPNPNDCPHHVGEYCWLGVQCNCGELVSPGFALIRRLENEELSGVEFKRVSEGSFDYGEVFSSEESSESANDDEVDRIEDLEEDLPVSQELDENIEWIVESDESQDSEGISDGALLSRPTQGHSLVTIRSGQRSIPRSVPTIGQFQRNPYHLPSTPSRLRNTWIPPSAPSSVASSQASEVSGNEIIDDNIAIDDLDWYSTDLNDGYAPYEFDPQWAITCYDDY
jgi:dual specificity phosphatase 12